MDQREQQATNVRPVDIGIRHQDDLVVTNAVDVETSTRSCTDHLNDGCAFSVLQHVCKRGLLDVQDLPPDRQKRLKVCVSGAFRRAQGTVAFDDEQFRSFGLATSAINEFGRQGRGFQC